MDSKMRVKLWGTRGMISSPRPETSIFGGNTSCIQVLYENKLIIVDTGFGVSNLGESLFELALKGVKLDIHILYTHFHWDHVQGLPFFHPIYFPTSNLSLYSPVTEEHAFDSLDILFDGSYSPFAGLKSMPSHIQIKQLSKKESIAGLTVEYIVLDHGNTAETAEDDQSSCFAYKFTSPSGESVVIATDHEARASKINDNFITFAKNTDLLIHGAQYTETEYKTRKGWGLSNFKQALDNATKIFPGRTILTHHDPYRNDTDIQSIYREYKIKKDYQNISFEFAREELVYEVQLVKEKKSA